jgi:hypothetical protein
MRPESCLIEGVEKYAPSTASTCEMLLAQELNLGDLPILFRNDAEAAVVGRSPLRSRDGTIGGSSA